MSSPIENFKEDMEIIIAEGRWDEVQPLYKEMEDQGYGAFVPEVSELMTDEDVREYKKWDKAHTDTYTEYKDNQN